MIANRLEIAVRIIRICKELSIITIIIYSEVDKDNHHIELADEKFWIRPIKWKLFEYS